MKKIAGILTVAAMATSMFAADVSAKVRVAGSLFDYDAKSEGMSILKAQNVSHTYDAPYATLTVSEENAGATVKLIADGDAKAGVSAGDWAVWFKPMDMLTIKAGSQDIAMNKETINWTSTNSYGVFGYSLGVAADAITVDVALGTNNGDYFFKDKKAYCGTADDPAFDFIRDLYAKVGYAADFGKIQAFVEYKGKTVDLEAAKKADKDTDLSKLYGPAEMKFGAGYNNTFDSLTMFADVVLTNKLAETNEKLKLMGASDKGVMSMDIDAFVQYVMDALTVKGYVDVTLGNNFEKLDKNTGVNLKAYVSYALDACKVHAQFTNGNLLKKDAADKSVFESTIEVGVDGSVGCVAWEVDAQFMTGKPNKDGKAEGVNVSVPVLFTASF